MKLSKFLNENLETFGNYLIQDRYFPYICDKSSQVIGAYIKEKIEDVRIIQGYYENSELFHVFLVRKNKDIIDFTLCQFFDDEESIKESFWTDEYLEISLSKSFKEDILQKYQLPLIIKEDDELYSSYYQEEEINFCHSLVLFARESSCFSEYLEKVKKLSKMELISA